jgi:hypothetical protein
LISLIGMLCTPLFQSAFLSILLTFILSVGLGALAVVVGLASHLRQQAFDRE